MVRKTALDIENQAAVCLNPPHSGRWRSIAASNFNEKNYLTEDSDEDEKNESSGNDAGCGSWRAVHGGSGVGTNGYECLV
jgi:hypothetical protein